MRKALACSAALLAAGALSPVWAGTVYIPVVRSGNGNTHATEVYVSNSATAARNFSTAFVKADSDGTVRSGTPGQTAVTAGGALRIASGAPAGDFGLLEVDAATELGISARLQSTAAAGGVATTRVPVISSANAFAAGKLANVLGLERQTGVNSTDLFVVNLGKAIASCEVKLFRADGTQVVPTATVQVAPLSMRPFPDVFGLIGQTQIVDARAQVSCNQIFYPLAALVDEGGTKMSFVNPSAAGTSTLTSSNEEVSRPLPAGTKLLFESPGLLLTPSKEQEIRIMNIPVPKGLDLKKMVIEMDFTVGPWNPRENDGPHAILWLHRGAYRSHTIANVNVHGPSKNKIRMNQNIDLPGLEDRIGQQGAIYEVGKTYHFTYTYDAEHDVINCLVTEGTRVVNNLNFPGTARRGNLAIPPTGMVVTFGHMSGLHYEVTSYGWKYSNFRIAITEY